MGTGGGEGGGNPRVIEREVYGKQVKRGREAGYEGGGSREKLFRNIAK